MSSRRGCNVVLPGFFILSKQTHAVYPKGETFNWLLGFHRNNDRYLKENVDLKTEGLTVNLFLLRACHFFYLGLCISHFMSDRILL